MPAAKVAYLLDENVQAHIGSIQASSLEMTRLILPFHENPQVIRKNLGFISSFAYVLGMASPEQFVDDAKLQRQLPGWQYLPFGYRLVPLPASDNCQLSYRVVRCHAYPFGSMQSRPHYKATVARL